MIDPIHQIDLFAGISDAEYQWLIAHSHEQILEPGMYWSREGEPAESVFIVLEGELQVSRTLNGELRVLGTTPRGIIGGELAILYQTPSQVNAVAIKPSRLMVFQEADFRELFGKVPAVAARILSIVMERTGGIVTQMTQQQKLDALQKVSANLAHSLNNPAAAASQSSRILRSEVLPRLQQHTLTLSSLGLSDLAVRSLIALQEDAIRDASHWIVLNPLERADREDQICAYLNDLGIEDASDIAHIFVDAGVRTEELTGIAAEMTREHAVAVVRWLSSVLDAAGLLSEIENSTGRIAELVDNVKKYTYMDRGKSQEVDLHRDLDSTLRIFADRLRNVQVIRTYDPALPHIVGRGSDLNQVWTNIIENALDAMNDQGTLRIITRCENEFVMVEITDDGPGIPVDVQEHIFEPFFSTKKFAQGITGLGLDIVYRITSQHNATVSVFSQPGETRFIVRLPLETGY
ncbi:MAG: ATP-binding protein [bacterium]|nr:ATP-binding protein [bacterium]